MNPGLARVPEERLEVRLRRGRALPGRAWRAESPRVRVAVVHGLGEHGGRYAALASDLVAAGASVCVLDLPGHGESDGARGDGEWEMLREDFVPALLEAARGLPGGELRLPLLLLGHSLGGMLALDFALAHPDGCAGLILSAPPFEPFAPPPAWELALANLARRLAPGARFAAGIKAEDRSRDPEVVRLAREDRAIHDAITPRLYFGLCGAQARVRAAPALPELPTLLLQGSADRIVSPAATRAFAERVGPERVTLRWYPEMFHELFNDIGRETVVADVRAWMEVVTGARGAS